MAISTGDYVHAASTFAGYISSDIVDLVNKLADADDERSIGPLRILKLMAQEYERKAPDTAPSFDEYLMTLPVVGSVEMKIKANEWSKLEHWRRQNDSRMRDRYYTKVIGTNGTSTLKVRSFYDNACEMVKSGQALAEQLSELEKTMGKNPVKSKIERYNDPSFNPMEKAKELAYLKARVGGLRNKIKLAVRTGQQRLNINRLLPDVKVTFSKTKENDLSPNSNPIEIEDTKSRSNWDTMTIGNFLRLDPQEAYDSLKTYSGDQYAALKATLGREREPGGDPSVILKDDMTADTALKGIFKLIMWMESASNRTALIKMKVDKGDSGATVRRNIALLYNRLPKIMPVKEMQEELDRWEEETDTRVQTGNVSKS